MDGEKFVEGSAKAVVVRWIENLTVSGQAVPDALKHELLDELANATPISDADGRMVLEIPGLASLGLGIFHRSFSVEGKVVRVAPYVERATTVASALASIG